MDTLVLEVEEEAVVRKAAPPKVAFRTLLAYATGTGATSLALGGIANFAMLYYTQALGLSAKLAGLALSVTLIWDALIGPIMGHITDNTRSRFGRRHPYILLGGLALGISFYFLWTVPPTLTGSTVLFWYLLGVNLVVRTAGTLFAIPYAALGFEICPTYEGRSRLQGVSGFFGQIVNFLGGALAWSLFFQDRTAPDGARIDGTHTIANYTHMSLVLTIAILCFVCLCMYATRHYAIDNRRGEAPSNKLRDFVSNFWDVVSDRHARYVYIFFCTVCLGTMIVAQVQMFTYVDFMKFTHVHKTIAHGAGMIACALGALLHAPLVRRYDKKQVGFIGVAISLFGNLMLFILFIGGMLHPEQNWIIPTGIPLIGGQSIPVAVLAFAFFQGLWWGGIGVLGPLGMSMVADISEINCRKNGTLKDGSYSAALGFMGQVSASLGMLINGWMLESVGFISGAAAQSPEAIRNIAILTFVSGPVFILLALPFLWKYPINRVFMARLSLNDRNNRKEFC